MKLIERFRAAASGDSRIPPFRESVAARQGEETLDDHKLSAPEVEELAQRRRALRAGHAGFASELEAAESAFRQIQAEIATLKAALAEREMEAARAGASAPVDGFEEEHQLARAERQGRVAEARVKLCRERAASSHAEIDETARKLKAAWREFGAKNYQEAIDNFRAAAYVLRQRYADLLVWSSAFRLLPPGVLIIEDASARKAAERAIVNTHIGSDALWRDFTRELAEDIGRLRAELEIGVGGQAQGEEE
jgi:hypothetical protein